MELQAAQGPVFPRRGKQTFPIRFCGAFSRVIPRHRGYCYFSKAKSRSGPVPPRSLQCRQCAALPRQHCCPAITASPADAPLAVRGAAAHWSCWQPRAVKLGRERQQRTTCCSAPPLSAAACCSAPPASRHLLLSGSSSLLQQCRASRQAGSQVRLAAVCWPSGVAIRVGGSLTQSWRAWLLGLGLGGRRLFDLPDPAMRLHALPLPAGISGPDEEGYLTYMRPEGKSGGHVGAATLPPPVSCAGSDG